MINAIISTRTRMTCIALTCSHLTVLLQVHKEPVGRRVSAQLHAMITADHSAVTQGPVATAVTAAVVQPGEVSDNS
jgi:hypothetical protein